MASTGRQPRKMKNVKLKSQKLIKCGHVCGLYSNKYLEETKEELTDKRLKK